MQKVLVAAALVLIIVLGLYLSPYGPQTTPGNNSSQVSREDRWHQDLDALYEALQARHPDPFMTTSQDRFDRAVERLHGRIAELSDDQMILELQKITAMVKDSHTSLSWGPSNTDFSFYPVKLYSFVDGFYVLDALDPYKDLIGSRLYQVDNTSVEEIYIRLLSYVSAENSTWPKLIVPYRLTTAEVLNGLGFSPSDRSSMWRLVDENDLFYNIDMNAMPYNRAPDSFLHGPALIDNSSDAPLYLSNTDEAFWLEYLADAETLYIQFNQVRGRSSSGSIAQFANQIESIVADETVSKVVVDLRHNGGGDNTTYGPLLNVLTQNAEINQEGVLYVLIGRNTFSAAVNFAAELEQKSEATFVGESTGNSPNMFGDCQNFKLPHSKLDVCISTLYWVKSTPDDTRKSIDPDFEIILSYNDYANHRDPVLQAILSQ